MLLIVTECPDLDVHRTRIETRNRAIPNWYELDWSHVQRSRAVWEPLQEIDLVVRTTDPWAENLAHLHMLLKESVRHHHPAPPGPPGTRIR